VWPVAGITLAASMAVVVGFAVNVATSPPSFSSRIAAFIVLALVWLFGVPVVLARRSRRRGDGIVSQANRLASGLILTGALAIGGLLLASASQQVSFRSLF
jgi:hypothetical protein